MALFMFDFMLRESESEIENTHSRNIKSNIKSKFYGQCLPAPPWRGTEQVSMYRGHLQSREYLLLAVNNAPPPKPVVIKMTQRE